jgi:hypothetical protein
MTVRKPTWAAAVAALVCLAPPAPAQVAFQFARDDGTAQTTFSVVQGQTINIRLYLFDSAAGAPTLSAEGGLSTVGVRVTSGTPSVATLANLATDVLPAIPPWSSGNSNNSTLPTSAVLNVLNFGAAGILPDAAGRVLLGTMRFTGLAVGQTALTAADPNPVPGDTTRWNPPFTSIDALLGMGTATLAVTPVPEPTGLALAGLAAAALAVARRRRAVSPPTPAA